MAEDQHTKTVTFRTLDRFPGYRFGDDGSAWSSKGGSWRRLKAYSGKRGHKYVNLKPSEGVSRSCSLHRLILEAFSGPCPDGMECCHNDGDPTNNALGNLRWDTSAANKADAAKHGSRALGERHGRSKLTEADVRRIRELAGLGLNNSEISRIYGMDPSAIRLIVLRVNWPHVA